MGCANGMCGVRPSAVGPSGSCCNDCAESEYRARAMNALNPWARQVRANPAFNPYDAGSYGGSSFLTDYEQSAGSTAPKTETGGANPALGLLQTGIEQAGSTARAWLDADLQRDRIRAQQQIEQARIDAGMAAQQTNQTNAAATDASASAGGSSSLLLLGGLGLAAAYMSGVFGKK